MCPFCDNPETHAREIARDELVWAFPTNQPVVPGHTLIVPVRHVTIWDEMTDAEQAAVLDLLKKIKLTLKKSFGAEGFNIAWNEGAMAGQSVPHFHLHVLPRKTGDAGITEYEPRKFLYRPGSREDSPQSELLAVAGVIKKSYEGVRDMIKAVILDCDGMVINSERVSDRYSREFGIPVASFTHFFTGEFQDCAVAKADLKEVLPKYFEAWNWKGSVDEFLEYWFDPAHNRWNKEFEPVLQGLRNRGIKVLMATNNEKYRTENLFESRGLSRWFDGVFASGTVGQRKPEREFFETILKKSGLRPEECVFWDNELKNISAARTVGFNAEQYFSLDQFTNTMEKYLAA